MKKRTLGSFMVTLLLLITFLAGCGGSQPTGDQASPSAGQPSPGEAEPASGDAASEAQQTVYPITVKDAAGRDVTIAAEPQRIVSVAPSNTELLFALGKGDALVGRSEFDDYPAEALAIESVGGFFPPDYEKILSLEPDLILLIGGSEEARAKLENEYGLTTFVVDPQTFAELYEGVIALGQVVNAQAAAADLVAEIQQEVAAIEAKAATADTRPVVFYQVWHDPLMTAGPGSFIDDMIRIAGGTNAAAAAADPWPQFSLEQLVAANPDLIVTASPEAAQEALAQKGWESLQAVKEARVLGLPDENIVVRPGPRLIQGLNWFAEAIHPELFAR